MGTAVLAVVVVVVVLLLGYLTDRGLRAAERRGWIYYRTRRAPKGAAAERLSQLGTIWDPSQAHWLAEMDQHEDELDEADDPADR